MNKFGFLISLTNICTNEYNLGTLIIETTLQENLIIKISYMIGHASKDQIFISKITEIVLSNLGNEDFGAKELASESGLSPHALNRRLKAAADKTLSQFIRETRLNRALEMLRDENVTVSEVAYKVGFSSPAYFNTCFHEFFGYPPGEVNKRDLDNREEINPVKVTAKQQVISSLWRIVIIGLSVILLFAVLLYQVSDGILKRSSVNGSSSLGNPGKSIAVLPFNNLSDSTANQYFIDGVMEEILTNLSKIRDLNVVSRTSVEQFRGSKISTTEIAKKLKVAYLLEGSGQKYGNRFRLRVQLIETSEDRHIWANSYEQEIGQPRDIFNIQSGVAESVASELKARITPDEKRQIEKIPTTSLSAYDFYQRGNMEFAKYMFPYFNKESLKKAEIFYLNAMKCDSNFTQAYVGLAYVLWKRWDQDNSVLRNGNINNYLDSMLVLADKALSIDDQIAEAYHVRGEYYSVKGSAEQALDEWSKALRYNSNDGPVYSLIGGMYEELDMVKSLENLQKAALLLRGPDLTQTLRTLGYDYYAAGFPENGNYFFHEALNLDEDSVQYFDNIIISTARTMGDYKKAADRFEMRYPADSTNENILLRLGYFHSLLGNDKESLKYYKKYLSVKNASNDNSRFTRYNRLGYAYFKCGFRKEADYYFNKQIETCKGRLLSVRPGEKIYWLYPLAGFYACMGDKAKAYENLKTFNHAKSFTLEWVTLLKTDPIFSSIRSEPEFQRIVRDVESKYRAEHERVRKWLEEQKKL
jgi:TolB-like protein/AraC-like DNA-binding protein/Tfp pilus assembly protein PilF